MMNYLFPLSILVSLFYGINVAYLLGTRSPQEEASIVVTVWLLVILNIWLIMKNKMRIYKDESRMILIIFIYLFVYSIVLHRVASFIVIVNVFIQPILLALYLKNYRPLRLPVFKIILVYFVIECLIAIIERMSGQNFFSSDNVSNIIDNSISSNYGGFRSASIHGHPLQGALMLTIVMSFIYISQIKVLSKILLLSLGILALLSYNTRSSIVFWGIMMSVLICYIVFSKQYSSKERLYSLLFGIIAINLLIVLLQSGWGGRLVELSLFDKNSAMVRIDVFYMFRYLDVKDFLWGVDGNDFLRIMYISNIGIIENYWISYILAFGLIFTALFVFLLVTCIKPFFEKNWRLKGGICIVPW